MVDLQVDPLKDKRVELVLGQLDELPTLPAVALKVLEATGREDGSAQEVVKLIASDPALTAQILKLVHRSDSGVRAEVNSVERAVVLLGFDAVRSAVLAVSVFQTFQSAGTVGGGGGNGGGGTGDGAAFSREAFWKHSIAVATCAELLARQVQASWGKDGRIDPSEAFMCGLLHDLGKVALDAALPKSFAKVVEATDLLRGNIADVERQIVGIDHMVVGKRLAEKWKLPNSVRDCAWLHGQTPSALPATLVSGAGKNGAGARLVNLITLADVIARELHIGYSGNHTFPVPRRQLLDAVGVTEAQLAQAMEGLVGAIEQRAAALGLGQTSTEALYQQALSQANRELSRANTQLAVKNKRLAVRAKFFDSLAEFHGQLAPDAAPSVVLRAIAETAREALGTSGVVAFSIPPGRNYAELVLIGGEGESETLLTDCVQRPGWPAAPGAVSDVTGAMDFVIELVSPKLGAGRRYWTALVAEGDVVGGVLWSAEMLEDEGSDRLSGMKAELAGLVGGWSLALRTSQIRDEARLLSEQLAEANRNLQDAQGELTRVRTLTTIAEMAAGAAHEMNNPLAVISGRSQLLAVQLTDEKLKRSAQQVAENAERLSGMITELMDFAKPRAPQVSDSDVGEIVRVAVEQAKGAGELTDRTLEVAVTGVPRVRVDPGQVASAVAEILANASQATEVGAGVIRISAAHDPFGGNVVLTVTDNGSGMDDNTLRRAFDPFFSSRPAGRRRGMGLAKAQRWIEGCNGAIRLESRPGGGTRAMIVLPALKFASGGEDAVREGSRVAASGATAGASPTVGSGSTGGGTGRRVAG